MKPRAGASDSGFTLIELLISLLMFALIAVAGLALVDSVLSVQGRTEARLDRLSAVQRAMLVISNDLEQIARGDLTGGGANVSFSRSAPGVGGVPVAVNYALRGGVLTRTAAGAPQVVLTGVTRARWRFFGGDWLERWPVGEQLVPTWPRAVEVELELAGEGGPTSTLRRVVVLPVRAPEAM